MRRFLLCLLLCVFLTPAAFAQSVEPPNDPDFGNEWALNMLGALCAWGYTRGSPAVTVAVIDSGVDMNHPDLAGRLRSDGYDFVDDDADPHDENGHGTNVAGIIAATLNNAQGIAGLAPNVSILPIRVMNARGKGSDLGIARGIRYAADKGAQVINLSLGATLTIGAEHESAPVIEAIRAAQAKGALVVVAAGNDFVPLPNAIVGDNPEALIVAATDDSDRLAPFSNYGEWVDVTAPGVHILSTMPTYETFLTSDAVSPDERLQPGYDYMSGTSQATPLVSALAALLFSLHPDWTPAEVAQAIKEAAHDISQANPTLASSGRIGAGRIDACATLTQAAPTAAPTVAPSPTPIPVEPAATVLAPTTAPTLPPAAAAPIAPTSRPPAPPEDSAPTRSRAFVPVALALGCVAVLLFVALSMLLRTVFFRPRRTTPQPAAASPRPPAPPTPPPTSIAPPWGILATISGPPRRFALRDEQVLIGRSADCTIVLGDDQTISRRHAWLRKRGDLITIEDAGSTHGTFLNGQRLTGPATVRHNDILQLGQTLLRME